MFDPFFHREGHIFRGGCAVRLKVVTERCSCLCRSSVCWEGGRGRSVGGEILDAVLIGPCFDSARDGGGVLRGVALVG